VELIINLELREVTLHKHNTSSQSMKIFPKANNHTDLWNARVHLSSVPSFIHPSIYPIETNIFVRYMESKYPGLHIETHPHGAG
jgi:hypothetical protein